MEAKSIEIVNDRPKKREKSASKIKSSKLSKQKTNNSKADKSKTFIIYEKRKMIEPLRKELLRRGWTEKAIEDSKTLPTFVWLSRSNSTVVLGTPLVNRLKLNPSKQFCYKDILINYGREDKNAELSMPRTFKLFANEKNEFIEDYRLTAYSNFIRFVEATGSTAFCETGKVNSNWIKVAIEKLEVAIVSDNYKSSEINSESDNDFHKFKKVYQSVVKNNSKIKANRNATKSLLQQCNVIYEKCTKVWKDFDKDGFYNLWLLKPARRSLGTGIQLFDDDVDILRFAKDNEKMKYLAQKYVGQFR